MPALEDKTVLIIGRGSGIARSIALAVSEDGGGVIAAGLQPGDLADAYRGTDISIEQVDVTDESSVAALAGRIAKLDHVVSTASARARGGYADLTAGLVAASFSTKVTGALLLAKHFAGNLPSDGSFLFMSGATALKPAPGLLAVAATNAAVDAITAGLEVELAPIRVNAIAPEPSTPGHTTLSATNGRPRCSKPGPRPIPPGASGRPTTSRPRRWPP